MLTIGTGGAPLNMGYDSSNRNSYLTELTSAGTGTGMYYNRDVAGRVTYREKDTISAWNWNLTNQWFYGFTGGGSAPDFIRDANWNIVEKTLQLPGGVLLTVKPQLSGNNQKQYSLPSALGRTLLTTNAAGTNTSNGTGPLNSFAYDPYGNPISGSVLPANTENGSYGYAGNHQKLTETNFTLAPIQMGARVYLSGLGRFTSVDPIAGGTPNSYVYVLDPINGNDFSGLLGVINSTGYRTTVTVVNNYGMQPFVASPAVAANQVVQVGAPASWIQSPGAPHANTGRTAAPDKPSKSFGSRIGKGVATQRAWLGGGLGVIGQKIISNPQVQGSAKGCLRLAAESFVVGGVVASLGGPALTGADIGVSCGLGAAGGYYDSVVEGSGASFRDLDTFNGVYKMLRYLKYF